MNALPLILTVFVACVVEAVEALTIVLAAGLTRQWRSTFQGMAAALVALAVVVGVLGPTITLLPLGVLRVVVGALLAIFGLQWLRKAVLRATGFKGLHDEAAAFTREVAAAREAGGLSGRPLFDASTRLLAQTFLRVEGAFPLIGCGGVDSAAAAYAKVRAGASLVQLYTGLIYRGPFVVRETLSGLPALLDADRRRRLAEAVGVDATAFAAAGATSASGAGR